MDVETERVERKTTRSPKDKILVDSGDEEQKTNAPLSDWKLPTDSSDEFTTVGDRDQNSVADVTADASKKHVLKTEETGPTESVVSETHVPATSSSKDDEFSITQAENTSASMSEPTSVTQTHNGEDRTSASNVPTHATTVASEPQVASNPPNEKEEKPAYALSDDMALATPKFCAGTETREIDMLPTSDANLDESSNASVRLVLTDKSSSDSVKNDQFENKQTNLNGGNNHSECVDHKNTMNSQDPLGGHVNGVCPSDLQEDATQELSNTGISVSEEEPDACKEVHSNVQDSLQPRLDHLDDIKEPEEPGHATECHLLHDNEETTDATSNEGTTDATSNEDVSKEGDRKEDEDGWIYVLGHDKLKKKVIIEGLENSRPIRGQVVTVNCVGHLEDGTEVDKHDNWSLTLGEDEFIHAFDLCVAIMNKGETCEILTDSRFAYGELGRDPDIPPNATISYIIELTECHDQREYSTLTVAERIQLSNEKRERGNYLYSRNEYSRSIDSYTRALKALDEDFESRGESPEELQSIIDTRIKCHNNMAAAQMKVGAWDVAAKSCDVVLKVQPENVKALFRKGKCLANKGNVSAAIPLLKKALKLEPETKIIHQELSRLEKKNRAQTESEKALYQKMLGTDKEPPAKKKNESTSRWLWYVAGGAAAVFVSLGLTAYRYIHV